MPTLLEAVDKKYVYDFYNMKKESKISIFIPKQSPLVSVPELLIINNCEIDKAGNPDDIKKRCVSIKELDLAQNKLSNWNEIFQIILNMPFVEFINLSHNRINHKLLSPPECCMVQLKSLVLNNTNIDWESIECLLKYLPYLEELHLSLNNYQNVLIDTLDESNKSDGYKNLNNSKTMNKQQFVRKITKAHLNLKKLYFSKNPIEYWTEICRLGRLFPNLDTLILSKCPLKKIDMISENNEETEPNYATVYAYFQNLKFLNINGTNISTWDDIDNLADFPKLKSLCLKNCSLWNKFNLTEHERRQLLIARLPRIEILNGGGIIKFDERFEAEKAFIRCYMNLSENEKPLRYYQLIDIHKSFS